MGGMGYSPFGRVRISQATAKIVNVSAGSGYALQHYLGHMNIMHTVR